ncbi:hypothetical protein OROHE_012440 [Orobanche hederae]
MTHSQRVPALCQHLSPKRTPLFQIPIRFPLQLIQAILLHINDEPLLFLLIFSRSRLKFDIFKDDHRVCVGARVFLLLFLSIDSHHQINLSRPLVLFFFLSLRLCGGTCCCFDCSGHQFLYNSLDHQLHLAFFSSDMRCSF